MTIAYFLDIKTTAENGPALQKNFRSVIVPDLLKEQGVQSVHLYIPHESARPLDPEEDAPELTLQIDVADLDALTSLFGEKSPENWFPAPDGSRITQDIFEPIHYTVEGDDAPVQRTAPLSFNVRYYRPVDDEQGFSEHYLAHHPQILARLPGVRNVLCYVPIQNVDIGGFPDSDTILGNEVAMDSWEALETAIESPVRQELREDMEALPCPPGPNIHVAYMREDWWRE